MDCVALQAEAHQERVDAENLLHLGQNCDTAASAGRNRLDAVNFSHCAGCGLVCIGTYGDEEAVAALAFLDLHFYVGRSDAFEMLSEQFCYLRAALVRDKTHGYFRVSFTWKHRLGAFAGVTAPDAAYVQAGTDAGALHGGVALFSPDFGYLQEGLVFFKIEGGPGQLGTVFRAEFHHFVVESGNGYAVVGIVQAGYHLAESVDRIGNGAAVMTGMQVLVGAGDLYLQITQPTHAAVDGRDFVRYHSRIRHQADIRLEKILVFFHPFWEGRAAYFFLALEDELHVVLQLTAGKHIFKGFQVHEELPLVVVGSPAPDCFGAGGGIFGDDRLEGVGAPFLKGFRRLYVVVPVHQHGPCLRVHGFAAEYHRIAVGREDLGLIGAGLHKKGGKPFRAAAHVVLMLCLCADGRYPQQAEKLFEEAFFVFLYVLFHRYRSK